MYVDPIVAMLGAWAQELSLATIALRILLSVTLSTVIGCERATKRHAAGVRTFVVTSLACTTAMLADCCIAMGTPAHLYFLSAASVIAVAVISVNSVLYSSRNQIKGLTTSVALWATGVIGLTAGAGYVTITLVAFILLMISLSWMPVFEIDLKNRSNFFEVHLELKNSRYLQEFMTTSRRLGLSIDDIEINPAYASSGLAVYSVSLSIRSAELKQYKTHKEIIEALGTLEYVHHIEEMRG